MRNRIRTLLAGTAVALALSVPATAEVGFGTDVVSRYVWRGADFGNAAAVQPWISYGTEMFEVGAWSSWSVTGLGSDANENDLYVSVNAGPVGITVTDYYFPNPGSGDFFSYSGDDGVHLLEVSAAVDLGVASVLGAVNVSGDLDDDGDSRNSFWVEASLPLAMLSADGTEVGLTIGAGDGVYTTDGDPMVASISLDVSKRDWFGSYILNPDAEISFLVIGKSF